ncbi:Bacterial alpha-L-rhamnosidase family protein [Arthrobacter sp. 9AX]|uniref:family 78 glycoside hydrolase catalytic domain n=1 Tax=Arthrobacter sp. 9AX TaxID=2653131 RepID=UPI0012F0DB13|nr:family 78 glycoside hydrolase catalytic domain [Arthrobacter sp. 9AX]VXC01759.1 Bacterial alpha-L-rhamnosidase family protein [Arthrobacter sp. 9AX]
MQRPSTAGQLPAVIVSGQLHARDLLTDGLSPCLTAGPRPSFSWQLGQPEHADPSRATQTGYELVVEDSAGTPVWSSGQVASGRLSAGFDGPALDDDTDYAWRVRVWDGSGMPGAWSESRQFSTGLGDAGWGADWIHRAPGGRPPLEVLDGALRVAGTPFLPVPCAPIQHYRLDARLRPVMGMAGILLRTTGPGTGLLLELSGAGSVVLRRAAVWEIPAPSAPATEVLASAVLPPGVLAGPALTGTPPGAPASPAKEWPCLTVTDDGEAVTVVLDGHQLMVFNECAVPGAQGRLALHQAPRSQAEYASLRITDTSGDNPGGLLLDHEFTAGTDLAHAYRAHWTGTTAHRQPDEWTLFSTTITLAGTVARARLFAAAHHHAQISLDGTPCLATTSFGYPGEGYYDAADVTGRLAGPGTATQAPTDVPLTALLHWYGPGQGRAAGLPGLLVRLSVHYTDGRREVFASGPHWHAAEAPYRQSGYRNDEGDPVEHLDGLAAAVLPAVGQLPPALSYGTHPTPEFPALHPRRTQLAEEFVAPQAFLTADDGTLVADFGQVIPGRPAVDFRDGVPGRTVMIRASYVLRADGRVDAGTTASQNTDMSFPYTQTAGPQQYRASVHLGFRYLELPGVEAVDLSRVGAVVVHGRHPGEGSFTSSDDTLNAVFRLLRDSALYGVQEQFVDTPTREKGQFLADAVNISYATMSLFGEHAYTAQALREFCWSAARYWTAGEDRGRYNAVYPNGDGKRDIPDFSLMIPEWAEEYYHRTGDLALVTELLPHLCDTADYALRYIPSEGPTAGLVTTLGGGSGPYLHGIVDWPAPGRFGYDMDCAAKTTVNAQAYSALMATARLLAAAGQEDAAARYARRARALAAAIRTRLRVDGLMVDGLHTDGTPSTHASQHATSYPLSLGITAPEYAPADARRIAAMGILQGPMTVHRLIRALLAQGLTDAVLDLLTNKDQPGWAQLLERGATFTWEAWDLVDGTDYSQSHAWSASVVKEILDHLLGVRYASAGGCELVVEPPLCRLEHARGSVPAGNGSVDISWTRTGGQLQLECTVPAGVTAVVRLPAGSYGIQGPTAGDAVERSAPVSAASVSGDSDGGPAGTAAKVDFRIHSGAWSFTPGG